MTSSLNELVVPLVRGFSKFLARNLHQYHHYKLYTVLDGLDRHTILKGLSMVCYTTYIYKLQQQQFVEAKIRNLEKIPYIKY